MQGGQNRDSYCRVTLRSYTLYISSYLELKFFRDVSSHVLYTQKKQFLILTFLASDIVFQVTEVRSRAQQKLQNRSVSLEANDF
ncbi:hypothetical protein RchiOBHm_Chr1g0366961 [Rosa chinensis]|uniref:Uncharacterized protein n=1 Tax=Rosa chinensis TaxID=74649 RepID=A0A2P6SKD9_ROSCH|nr:hypothetical protein RchiOBHm_Chr1g0366961 [Rosa chinensis]